MKLTIKTKGNTDIIDITQKIDNLLQNIEITEGLVNIFVKGSTAALTTIEADPNLYIDLKNVLDQIIPPNRVWKHHQTWGDDNGSSHLKASIIGPSLSVPLSNGQMQIGSWQRIVLIDFDTLPRQREIILSVFKST